VRLVAQAALTGVDSLSPTAHESKRGDDLGLHTGPIETIAISSNNLMLISGGTDTAVRLWDLVTGQAKVLTGHTAAVRGLNMSIGEGLQMESEQFAMMVPTHDLREGLDAWQHRRAPRFVGR
jgi:WD40 repeat protein